MAEETVSEAVLAQGLLAAGGAASLATLEPGGGPFASYVVTAAAPDGAPLLFLSRLAVHARNLERDPRASLLFVREPAGGEAMTAMRLTLTGEARKDGDPALRERFLARHPDAARYAGFVDFSIYRFEVAAAHFVAGFGRIVSFAPEEILPIRRA